MSKELTEFCSIYQGAMEALSPQGLLTSSEYQTLESSEYQELGNSFPLVGSVWGEQDILVCSSQPTLPSHTPVRPEIFQISLSQTLAPPASTPRTRARKKTL